MTKRSRLLELAERCERATEPSRELADEVLFAFGWRTNHSDETIAEVKRDGGQPFHGESGEEGFQPYDDFVNCACWYPPNEKPWIEGFYRPNPTESVDAALTLVPPHHYLDLHDWRWTERPRWIASLQNNVGNHNRTSGEAATPALALCAAALRALAAMEPDDAPTT